MKRTLAAFIISVAVAAGCGSSGGPLFEGFVHSGGSAVVFAPTTCSIPFVGDAAVAGIIVDLASFADSCDVINATQLCGNKANSTRVLGFVMSGEVGAASTNPVAPGTFSYLPDPPTGKFTAAAGTAAQVDNACQAVPGTKVVSMTGGSITISAISDTNVTGTTNMKFDSGEVYEQAFDLSVCTSTVDLCGRFEYCGSHTCVP